MILVLSNDKNVRTSALIFLKRLTSHTDLTDPNHKVKNGRYQMVIGGNNPKTVGDALIDTGLLPDSKIAKDLWEIKEFASNLIVLHLASTETVLAVMYVQINDPRSVFALRVTLFFMRAHTCLR